MASGTAAQFGAFATILGARLQITNACVVSRDALAHGVDATFSTLATQITGTRFDDRLTLGGPAALPSQIFFWGG